MQGNPLEALRDIHLPETAGWWPLAWGYWLLLALCIGLVIVGVRHYRSLRLRRSAQRAFDQVVNDYQQHREGLRLARELAVLMRRVLLTMQPRQDVARLTGAQWANVVQQVNHSHQLQETSLEVLSASVYQSTADFDANSLITDCMQWFAQLPAQSATKKVAT